MPAEYLPSDAVLDHQNRPVERPADRRGGEATSGSVTDLDIIQWRLDPNGVVVSANAAGTMVSSWDDEPVRLLTDLTHPNGRAALQNLVTTAVGRGRSAGTLLVRGTRPRTLRHLQLLMTRVAMDGGPSGSPLGGVEAVSLRGWDITSLNAKQHGRGAGPSQDPLTGAESRSAFLDRLDDAQVHRWAPGQRIALLMVEVRELVDDEETFARDVVLSVVAGRLMSVLRPGDRLGRTGAAEFAVLCHSMTGWSDLSAVVERLRSVVLKPVHVPQGDLVATMAVGAVFPDEPAHGRNSADALLARTAEWMSVKKVF